MTRLLVTGKNGQVGWELQRSLQCLGEVIAVDRAEFDLARPETLRAKLNSMAPDVIVNAAAYTAVDKAESDEATAMTVNGAAPTEVARWAASNGALLVHYSTDYVFDGTAQEPYSEEAIPSPVNAYGRSKLAGEMGIAQEGCDHLILRTSWVYASRGKNFLLTMLRLANERANLRIVDDQAGSPTWARNIAEATTCLVLCAKRERESSSFRSATLNMTAAGKTSWFGFADEIVSLAAGLGLIESSRRPAVTPINSVEYPTPARRPSYSVLDGARLRSHFAIALPDWKTALALCMAEIRR